MISSKQLLGAHGIFANFWHMRWKQNDLARSLDEQEGVVQLSDASVEAWPVSSLVRTNVAGSAAYPPTTSDKMPTSLDSWRT
jgi:hypothetical protein